MINRLWHINVYTKYVKLVYEMMLYEMMLNDLNLRLNKPNWAYYVKHLLQSLGFNNVWLKQGVEHINSLC